MGRGSKGPCLSPRQPSFCLYYAAVSPECVRISYTLRRHEHRMEIQQNIDLKSGCPRIMDFGVMFLPLNFLTALRCTLLEPESESTVMCHVTTFRCAVGHLCDGGPTQLQRSSQVPVIWCRHSLVTSRLSQRHSAARYSHAVVTLLHTNPPHCRSWGSTVRCVRLGDERLVTVLYFPSLF